LATGQQLLKDVETDESALAALESKAEKNLAAIKKLE
jgi:hypothetical protein